MSAPNPLAVRNVRERPAMDEEQAQCRSQLVDRQQYGVLRDLEHDRSCVVTRVLPSRPDADGNELRYE
jgi:hypothetical protein